ncbi:amino acid/polyamine transporter I [Cunninghamella echinulata]|nr:amino acid/polyamine transporter I [Cunninghamella echinulata]
MTEKPNSQNDADVPDGIAPMAVGDQKMSRHITFFGGTMFTIGGIIGTGIFSNSSYILQSTGSGGMMLLMWAIGALFACCGLATYLELGTMLPRSGAEKEYLSYIYPHPRQLVPFIYMIICGVLVRCGELAQASIVFGENIIYSMHNGQQMNQWAAQGFGVFCITFWITVNIFSYKCAVRFNNFFSMLKIALLVLLVCIGFAGLAGRLPKQPNLKENFSFNGTLTNLGSYANGIYFVIFSYSGYYSVQTVTDELKDPIRNLPRIGVTSIFFVTIIYILANVAYLAVLPLDVIRESKLTVAADLFSAAFGGVFGTRVLPIFVGLSSFGFVGISTYAGSRVVLEFSRQGHLPFDRFFSKLHPTLQTPIRSLMLIYVITLIFMLGLPPGTAFEFIMSFVIYGEHIFATLCAIGVLILRRREPNTKRPIRAPVIAVLVYSGICIFTNVFVFITPKTLPPYPYYAPYLCTVGFIFICVGLWYIKMYLYNGLENSYNNSIKKEGQLQLANELKQNNSMDTLSASESQARYDLDKLNSTTTIVT